ncbi:TPA: hypothetical protein U0A14_004877, partial [Escherichia coli]|nr:hypothetical protein [Escherichia coli]
FSTECPQVTFFITSTKLQRQTVIQLAVTQINHAPTQTTLTTVPHPDPTLEGNPRSPADTTLFSIQGADAPEVCGFHPWL